MDLLEEVADKLAQDVLKAVEATGNEHLVDQIKDTVGASSTTLEEAFSTSIRIRRAESRGRALLEQLTSRSA